VQAAREAARRSQCVNNLKQLGLASHNYLSSNNCFPQGDLYPTGSQPNNGWSIGWTVSILPQIEQQSLFNAYNFSFSYADPSGTTNINSTVGYTQVAAYLCPSDGVAQRPGPPWGALNYVGNNGGPGEQQTFSGTIISVYWGDSGNAPTAGTIGTQAVTDGTSNTAMFSERLLGLLGSPQVFPGKTSNSKRGNFATSVAVTINNRGVTGLPGTTALLAACNSLPGTTPSAASNYNGRLWIVGYPWNYVVNRYTHVGTPNTMMCYASNSFAGSDGGPQDTIPPTSNHSGGVNMCMADGSVRFVKDSVSVQTFWAIGTRDRGEVISADSY
jgi:prepilin-type processing-associated H-X9-DG protein